MSNATAIAKTYNMTQIKPAQAKELLSAEQRIIVTQNIFQLTVAPKVATIKSAFGSPGNYEFLISKKNPDIMCIVPGAWHNIFFMNLATNKVEYLVTVESEKRQPFEKVADEDDDTVPSEKTLEFVKYVIDSEGFDYAFRDYSDFKNVKDKKFHALRKAYIAAAEAMEEYLAG